MRATGSAHSPASFRIQSPHFLIGICPETFVRRRTWPPFFIPFSVIYSRDPSQIAIHFLILIFSFSLSPRPHHLSSQHLVAVMHIFQHHVRQLQTKLADVKRKTGLQYLQDKQECEVNENAYFADMRLRESVNCFDPSFSLPGLETGTAHNASSLSDIEYEEVFKQFTAFPDSEDTPTGDESKTFNTELRPINDDPLEVWPLPLPLPVPIAPAPEHPKANARTRSMMDEVRSATRRRALLRLRDLQSQRLITLLSCFRSLSAPPSGAGQRKLKCASRRRRPPRHQVHRRPSY